MVSTAWLTTTANLLFSLWGERAKGAGLPQPSDIFCTVVFQLILTWWSFRSGVCCAKASAVVVATVWIWFLLQMGKKGAVGRQFLPQCCADSQSVAVGLSVAGGLVWCSCFCRAQGGEAAGQPCSCSRLGLGGLSQHLPPSLAVGAWESSPCTGRLPSCTAFQVLALSPAFPVPSLGPPVSGRAQLHPFLWPFICRVEQCPAHSGPLVLLTFKCMSNEASEPLHQSEF